MKQFLLWFYALFFSITTLAQNKNTFEKETLENILPEVEKFYDVNFSYTDMLIKEKKASIILDKYVSIKSLLLTLSSQTNLKFELISDKNITISAFTNKDLITVCGQLLANNEVIPNALLQINETLYSTDEKGLFQIDNIPYNSEIEISSFGAQSVLIKANKCAYPNCITITLKEKKELLDQIVINSYLTSGISKNIKQTTINTKKLNLLPGLIEPDILESIHQIPGVTNLNETVNSIQVRGGNADQNLIRWNNIRMYNTSHLFGEISAFNPYVINKVNFINKGTSAKYGERISSVIDIKSDYKPNNKIHGGAGFNLIHTDAFINIPLQENKLSLLISGRRSFADAYKTITYSKHATKVFQNTKIIDETVQYSKSKNIFWFYDYTINASYKPTSKDLIKFNHIYTKDYLNFSAFSEDKNNLYTDELKTQNQGYNIDWQKEWSKNINQEVNVIFSEYLLDYSFNTENNQGLFSNKKINTIKDFGINIDLKYDLSNFKQLNFGYHFSNKNFKYKFNYNTPTNNNILDAANNRTNANSLYTEYQINKPKDYLFTAGIRANKYSNSKKFYIEPRAIIQKFVIPEFSINASIEYKSQYVNQIQESVISNLGLENQIWALSNKTNLPILTSYQYTVGANYSKNKWIIDFEAYFKKINNINTFEINLNDNTFYNTGSSSIEGVDVFIKKQFKNYNSWLAYSFISAKYLFNELNNGIPFPSNVDINHTIKWSHFYKWKKMEFSLGWIWHSGKPYTNLKISETENGVNQVTYESINNANLRNYHRLDFSAVYNIRPHKNKKIKYRVGLSLMNVYNKNNIINKDIRYTNNLQEGIIINNIYGIEVLPNIVLRIFW